MKLLTPKKKARSTHDDDGINIIAHQSSIQPAADRTFIIILLTAIARCLYQIANP